MRAKFLKIANAFLAATAKAKVVSFNSLYPWQKGTPALVANRGQRAPNPRSPRLTDLRERYRYFDPAVTVAAVWTEGKVRDEDLTNFRGDTQYVWQRGDMNGNEIAYSLSYYANKAGPASDLLAQMHEDGAFGVSALKLDDRLVSRDLLDSVGEIDFLRRHTGVRLGNHMPFTEAVLAASCLFEASTLQGRRLSLPAGIKPLPSPLTASCLGGV